MFQAHLKNTHKTPLFVFCVISCLSVSTCYFCRLLFKFLLEQEGEWTIDENNLAGGLVGKWFRLFLSLDLPPFSAGPPYCQELAKRQEGKQTEIQETSVLLAYLVKMWRKERESKGILKYYPNLPCVPYLLVTQLLLLMTGISCSNLPLRAMWPLGGRGFSAD